MLYMHIILHVLVEHFIRRNFFFFFAKKKINLDLFAIFRYPGPQDNGLQHTGSATSNRNNNTNKSTSRTGRETVDTGELYTPFKIIEID